jgi:hypothetical protein
MSQPLQSLHAGQLLQIWHDLGSAILIPKTNDMPKTTIMKIRYLILYY